MAASALAVCLSAAGASAGAAQQDENRWTNSSKLSFVRTGGNAEASTLGIATTWTRSWERSEVKVEAGGIRTRTTQLTRTAVGTLHDYRLVEEATTMTSAENYHVRMRLDRRVSDRTAFFVQSGWTRNTFAGIQNRLVNVLGISTRWAESERQDLRTAYGLTHTIEQHVVPDPEGTGRFLGIRVSGEFRRRLTDNTDWQSDLVVDGNGDDLRDLRADWTNSLSVSMNEHLGLKTSYRATFDNRPSLASVPLRSRQGEPAGELLVPRKSLDDAFTVALVVSF
jgi:putative salt-induced outer membrane protein YdiY